MAKKLTAEICQERIDNSTVTLEILEPYVNSKTKLLVRCTQCGDERLTTWQSICEAIKKGSVCCTKCANISKGDKLRKSNEQYIEEIKNKPFKAREVYLGDEINIKHQCTICTNIWKPSPKNILNGTGCPYCAKIVNRIRWDGKRDESLKIEGLKIPCSLYILDSEDCIKVGISNQVNRRVKQLSVEGFTSSIFQEYKLNTWDAIMVEQNIHNKFKSYESPIYFKGHTELHYKEDLLYITEFIKEQLN